MITSIKFGTGISFVRSRAMIGVTGDVRDGDRMRHLYRKSIYLSMTEELALITIITIKTQNSFRGCRYVATE